MKLCCVIALAQEKKALQHIFNVLIRLMAFHTCVKILYILYFVEWQTTKKRGKKSKKNKNRNNGKTEYLSFFSTQLKYDQLDDILFDDV